MVKWLRSVYVLSGGVEGDYVTIVLHFTNFDLEAAQEAVEDGYALCVGEPWERNR